MEEERYRGSNRDRGEGRGREVIRRCWVRDSHKEMKNKGYRHTET